MRQRPIEIVKLRTARNYTPGRSGAYHQVRIHTSEVQAEVHHLEAFLHKLPHHVGRSYWSTDRAPKRDQRTYWGTVRCRPEEHAAIREKARAVGMSEAGFIRAVVFGWPMGRGDHREAVIQLRRFENNLRQLQNWWTGRWCDSGAGLPVARTNQGQGTGAHEQGGTMIGRCTRAGDFKAASGTC